MTTTRSGPTQAETGWRSHAFDDESLRLEVPPWAHLVAVAAVVGTVVLAAFVYLGPIIGLLVGTTAVAAFVAWSTTTFRHPAQRRVIPWYTTTIVVMLMHEAERFGGDYAAVVTDMIPTGFGDPVIFTEYALILTFIILPTAVYLLGIAGIFYHHPLGNYSAWWLFIWSIILPLSHFALPLFASDGYCYIPGMWTAPVPVAAGIVGIRLLLRHQLKREAPT